MPSSALSATLLKAYGQILSKVKGRLLWLAQCISQKKKWLLGNKAYFHKNRCIFHKWTYPSCAPCFFLRHQHPYGNRVPHGQGIPQLTASNWETHFTAREEGNPHPSNALNSYTDWSVRIVEQLKVPFGGHLDNVLQGQFCCLTKFAEPVLKL